MIYYLSLALIGICLGTLTGLIPGLHVNNLTPVLVGFALGSTIDPWHGCCLIVSMMLTHTFLDFIPSTFLGVPNEDTALSVLPAHRLVQEGRGYVAIKLTALGSLGALFVSAALASFLIPAMSIAYNLIKPYIYLILIAIALILFYLEKNWKDSLIAAGIFVLSGFLGLIILNTNLVGGESALAPLLSGMFGMSVLLISLNTNTEIPEQKIPKRQIDIKSNIKPIFTGSSAGLITGILPGVGPAQGTVLSQLFLDSNGPNDFLIGISGVNTAKAILSFITLYAIGRPRSGAAVAVEKIMKVELPQLISLIGIALFAGGIATLLHLKIGKIVAKKIKSLPYRLMCLCVISIIILLSVLYSGIWGIPILITSTSIGLLPPIMKVKRTHCMGCLMVPIILYFSGLENTMLSFLGL